MRVLHAPTGSDVGLRVFKGQPSVTVNGSYHYKACPSIPAKRGTKLTQLHTLHSREPGDVSDELALVSGVYTLEPGL